MTQLLYTRMLFILILGELLLVFGFSSSIRQKILFFLNNSVGVHHKQCQRFTFRRKLNVNVIRIIHSYRGRHKQINSLGTCLSAYLSIRHSLSVTTSTLHFLLLSIIVVIEIADSHLQNYSVHKIVDTPMKQL